MTPGLPPEKASPCWLLLAPLREAVLAVYVPASDVAAHVATLRSALADPEFKRPAFTCTVPPENSVWTHWPPSHDAHDAPLGLVMIVKDEVQSIKQTIASARPHIDGWTLVDTGSTDGTQAAIREAHGDRADQLPR